MNLSETAVLNFDFLPNNMSLANNNWIIMLGTA